jgi:hypothetical protein
MDRLINALILLLCSAGLVCAAVSKETAPAAVFGDSVSSLSISGYTVTCGGGNPLIAAAVGGTDETVNTTGVTYNSLALTQKTEMIVDTDQGVIEVWYRVGTTGSAQTLTANFSTAGFYGFLAAQAYCGVDQASPLGTAVTVSGLAVDVTVAVTVPANGMALGPMVVYGSDAIKTLTGHSGVTIETEANDSCCNQIAWTTRTATGNCGATWAGPGAHAGLICVPINPAAVVTGNYFMRRRF